MAGVLSAPDVAVPAQLQLSVVLSRQLQSTEHVPCSIRAPRASCSPCGDTRREMGFRVEYAELGGKVI